MEAALEAVGLRALLPSFQENKIDLTVLNELNDRELIRLGVDTIGDRVRLRQFAKAGSRSTTSTTPSLLVLPEAENSPGKTSSHSLADSATGTEVARELGSLFGPSRCRYTSRQHRRSSNTKTRTWTAKIYCLADKNKVNVPTSSEKILLTKCGLGLKKIQFSSVDDETQVYHKITTEFPKLKDAGGVELLRCIGNCRMLEVIDGKWDVGTLKSLIGSQCTIYVRPVQKSLNVEIDAVESRNQIQEICQNCLKSVSLVDLRSHLEECKATVNDEVSETNVTNVISMVDAHEETDDNDIIQTVLNLTDLIDVGIHDREIDLHSETEDIHQQDIVNEPVFIETTDNTGEIYSCSIHEAVEDMVKLCEQNEISNPVEILRLYQKKVLKGRKLDIEDESSVHVGSTNFILVNRSECLKSGMEEIKTIEDLRICLEVQFYGESAIDFGGPRKEFFGIILKEIQQEYFQPVKEWSSDYEVIGKIMALSTLQNGKLPRILSPDLIEEVFVSQTPRQFVKDLRSGLDSLGLFQCNVDRQDKK